MHGSSFVSSACFVRSVPNSSSVGVLDPPRRAPRAGRRADSLLRLAHHANHLRANLGRVRVEVLEHSRRDALALAKETEEQVLGADVVVSELTRLLQRELQDALGARGERNLHGDEAAAAADDLLDLDARFLERDACGENIVENIGQDRGGGGRRIGSRGAHSSAQSAAERIRSTGGGTRGERGSRRARRTHGLEDLRGDTGAFADEAEHDLRGEGARGRVSGSRSGRADAGFHQKFHRNL